MESYMKSYIKPSCEITEFYVHRLCYDITSRGNDIDATRRREDFPRHSGFGNRLWEDME